MKFFINNIEYIVFSMGVLSIPIFLKVKRILEENLSNDLTPYYIKLSKKNHQMNKNSKSLF